MEKTSTFPNEMIHITPKYVVHLHGHRNKMVPLMKPFILANFNDGVKFHSCARWSTKDSCNHHLSCQVTNHHISNKVLILTSDVKIIDVRVYHYSFHTMCLFFQVRVYMMFWRHHVWLFTNLRMDNVLDVIKDF